MIPVQQALPLEYVQPPDSKGYSGEGRGRGRNAHLTLGCPCDGCDLASRCDREHIACNDYAHWMRTGEPPSGDRDPTREIYRMTYHLEA